MTEQADRLDAERLIARLDLELRLVEDAIRVVAIGASRRVTIGGIRFGDELFDRASALAARAGLRATAIYRTDEHGSDLVIEREDEGWAP